MCEDVQLCELKVDGYKIEYCVSDNRRTGGVLALVRNDTKYKAKYINCVNNIVWTLAIEIIISEIKYLITVLYHPPQKENAKFIDYFNSYLSLVCSHEGINIILGDFNYDLWKSNFYGNKILNCIYSNGFNQIVNCPTRITENSETLLDYIVTNNKNLCFKVHLTPKIGDHSIISLHLDSKHDDSIVSITKRTLKNYNVDNLHNHLLNINWNNNFSNVNILANKFVKDINDILNVMCPVRKLNFRKKYQNKKWITLDIKQKWYVGTVYMYGQFRNRMQMSGMRTNV